MVQAVEDNPMLNASTITRSKELNPLDLSLSTVNRTLNRNGLMDYTSVPENIKEDNKASRLVFVTSEAQKIAGTI